MHLVLEDVLEQRGLAAAQEAREERDRNCLGRLASALRRRHLDRHRGRALPDTSRGSFGASGVGYY